MLSGNKVIADEKTAGALRSVWSRALAIEMESAGVAAALYQTQNGPGFVMIKGISDRADSQKDDLWREYAADAAGAYAAAFLGIPFRESDLQAAKERPKDRAQIEGIPMGILRFALSQAFDLGELKVLAFDLEIKWDELRGETLAERVIELIGFLDRRRRLPDLIELVRRERPGLLEAYSDV